MAKKTIVISSIVVVTTLLGGGIWWLFSSGRLVYSANPSSSVSRTEVCDDSIVDRYNEVSRYVVKNPGDQPTYDEEGLAKLADDIRAKDRYKSDPTCQAILFFVAVRNDKYEDANATYQSLLELHKQGAYANSNIRSNEPLFNYPDFFNALSGAPVRSEE